MKDTAAQVKVVFPFEQGAETLWADPLAEETYRLDNVPLFAYGVNLHDVFRAKFVEGDERPYFDRALERSGNNTVRVTLPEGWSSRNSPDIEGMLMELKGASAGHERYGPDYFVYNIPAGAALEALAKRLDEGEDKGMWSWELSCPKDEGVGTAPSP